MDLVIRGGTVVTGDNAFRADVGIEGERIVALAAHLEARRTLDATDRLVLPGAIDPHVHMSLTVGPLRLTSSDDFASGSIAAACGGTTTFLDFTAPPDMSCGQSLRDALVARRALADAQVAVDYGLHITLADARDATLAEIPHLIAAGCPTFKLYMAYEGLRLDDGQLWAILDTLARAGGLPIVHCENHHVILRLAARHQAAGQTAPRYHALVRPAVMEGEATARLLALARLAGCPAYIVHVSCREALAAICAARACGQQAYGETCPHYLTLTADEYDRPDFEAAKYVMSPPLRTAADREALWHALAAGELQVVATDHCPFFYQGQKERGRADFTLIPGGIPGVETRLALLYHHGVNHGRLSLAQWVATCCTNPARLFGLWPQKGQLGIGSDADIVIFDPQREVTLHAASLHQRVDYTPYEGQTVRGYPVHVLSRGELIVEDGRFVGQTGRGRFLPRGVPLLPPV